MGRKTPWKNGIENKDYVICKICNEKLRQIHSGHGHLRIHKISINEYKGRFPDALTVCQEYSRLTAEGNRNRELDETFGRNISKALKGHPSYQGKNNVNCRPDVRKKKSISIKKSFENPKRRQQNREAMIRRMLKSGQFAGYNDLACDYFQWLNMWMGWEGKHALNGGEHTILGYWLDYYEPTMNMVIEWDEENHYRNNKLQEKDIQRQKEIVEELKCDFYRIRGKNMELSLWI